MDHGAHMRLDLVDQRFGDEFKLHVEQAYRAVVAGLFRFLIVLK